jgi:hypothetical protein
MLRSHDEPTGWGGGEPGIVDAGRALGRCLSSTAKAGEQEGWRTRLALCFRHPTENFPSRPGRVAFLLTSASSVLGALGESCRLSEKVRFRRSGDRSDRRGAENDTARPSTFLHLCETRALSVAFVEAGDLSFRFPFRRTGLQVGSLITLFFAFANADLDFDAMALPIHAQCDQGIAFNL